MYVGLRDSHMVAFDRKTGERRWEFRTGNPNYSAPVVQDGVLYMGSADSHLYALDAATGEQRWKFNAGAWISTSPSISENNVAVLGRGLMAAYYKQSYRQRGVQLLWWRQHQLLAPRWL